MKKGPFARTIYLSCRKIEHTEIINWLPRSTDQRADEILKFLKANLPDFKNCVKKCHLVSERKLMNASLESLVKIKKGPDFSRHGFRVTCSDEDWQIIRTLFRIPDHELSTVWRARVLLEHIIK